MVEGWELGQEFLVFFDQGLLLSSANLQEAVDLVELDDVLHQLLLQVDLSELPRWGRVGAPGLNLSLAGLTSRVTVLFSVGLFRDLLVDLLVELDLLNFGAFIQSFLNLSCSLLPLLLKGLVVGHLSFDQRHGGLASSFATQIPNGLADGCDGLGL